MICFFQLSKNRSHTILPYEWNTPSFQCSYNMLSHTFQMKMIKNHNLSQLALAFYVYLFSPTATLFPHRIYQNQWQNDNNNPNRHTKNVQINGIDMFRKKSVIVRYRWEKMYRK